MEEGIRINVSGTLVVFASGSDYSGMGYVPDGRGSVGGFSESSAYRMRRYLRETKCEYRTMVTLTYPPGFGIDGTRSKNDLRRFVQELRRYAKNERWGCFWFLEFQRNGRIHFHLFVSDYYDKSWIASTWFRIVGSNDENHLRAGTRIEQIKHGRKGISSYASKYAAKFEQKLIPNGFGWVGRFWGVQGYKERVAAAIVLEKAVLGAPEVKKRVQKLISRLKTLQSQNKSKNLTQKLKKAYPGIFACWVLNENEREIAESIQKNVEFIEIFAALHERREVRIEQTRLEEIYDEWTYELRIDDKEYYPCPLSA